MDGMVELGNIVLSKQSGRQSPARMTLFRTAGLSGADVAGASEALRRAVYLKASSDQQRSH